MGHVTIETKYWTTRVVQAFFDVGPQALIIWRRESLPHTVVHGNRFPLFLYEPKEVKLWAKENSKKTYPKAAKEVLAQNSADA